MRLVNFLSCMKNVMFSRTGVASWRPTVDLYTWEIWGLLFTIISQLDWYQNIQFLLDIHKFAVCSARLYTLSLYCIFPLKFLPALLIIMSWTSKERHLDAEIFQLHGKKQTISQMIGFIDSFRRKLELFKYVLEKNELLHFLCCRKLSGEEEMEFVNTLKWLEIWE